MLKDPTCGMSVDEKTALKLVHRGNSYFFCSRHCMEKFAKKNKISEKHVAACLVPAKAPFYKNKSFIVAGILGSLMLLSYVVPTLEPFRSSLLMYFKKIWWAVLLGFFIGGIIDHYVPREYVSYILAKPKKRTIFYSVILGFFMSACSHGILALSIELHKKGASNPAVVAFLLASPWANMALTIMLIGFFGVKALFIILSAIVIAVITGFIFQFLQKVNLIEKNENVVKSQESFSIIADIKERFRSYKFSLKTLKEDLKGIYKGAVSLSNMVLWWILIGMGLASLAGAYIPSNIFQNYMGPTLLGLMLTLFVATVIEVCSEGSAPMAFEIFKQTGALGNSFVFLMAGVATDYTEIGLLWHNVGKRTAIWLPIVTVPQVVLLGVIANLLF
ncbi:MAG: permease [Candidatus Omnitrophota bacterium]|nr:MAG: permease [Candidatus Omnitrophota bacterium]